MIGFARHRRQLLEAELQRLTTELPPLGVEAMYLTGEFARGDTGPETALELIIVQATDEPFHRRPDFFVTHVRPRIETRFIVYTPQEFERLSPEDPVLRAALESGEQVIAGQ